MRGRGVVDTLRFLGSGYMAPACFSFLFRKIFFYIDRTDDRGKLRFGKTRTCCNFNDPFLLLFFVFVDGDENEMLYCEKIAPIFNDAFSFFFFFLAFEYKYEN